MGRKRIRAKTGRQNTDSEQNLTGFSCVCDEIPQSIKKNSQRNKTTVCHRSELLCRVRRRRYPEGRGGLSVSGRPVAALSGQFVNDHETGRIRRLQGGSQPVQAGSHSVPAVSHSIIVVFAGITSGWLRTAFYRLGPLNLGDALSLDQILIPCAIRSLAARKPSSLLCRASQPYQRAPQLAIPVRLLSIKPPSLAIAM